MPQRRRLLLVSILLGLAVLALASASVQRQATTAAPSGPPQSTPAQAPPISAALPGVSRTIRASVGQLVELDVSAPAPDTATIDGFDLRKTVDPSTPAHFSLVPDRVGRFPIRLQDSNATLGVLVVGGG